MPIERPGFLPLAFTGRIVSCGVFWAGQAKQCSSKKDVFGILSSIQALTGFSTRECKLLKEGTRKSGIAT